MSKVLIKQATLIDGTGRPSFKGDLLIVNERIDSIAPEINCPEAEVLNAKGLFLTPGFIDVHSHSDFSILVDPYATGKIFQGITTEVIGNCGQSAFPLKGACRDHIQKSWDRFDLKLDWEDLPSYRNRVEQRGTAVNLAPLMGQGNIRASVMGYKENDPTEEELNEMQQLSREAMKAGAFGMSTGLIYLPGTFSKRFEIISVMQEIGKAKGIYATHLRNEGDTLLEAVDEAIEIARESNTSLQLSHLKTWGNKNWHKCAQTLDKVKQAESENLSIHFDRYPYLAAYTDLDAVLPPWTYEGGKETEIKRLKDKTIRAKITKELKEKIGDDKNYWNTIAVSSVVTEKNKPLEGLSVQEIADQLNQDPIEIVYQILIEEKLEIGAVFFAMCEENLKTIYQHKNCMVGSDSCARPFEGPLADGKFHPRTYGTFPRFFAEFVKTGFLSWEEAVYRATGLAAEKFGFVHRGKLIPGYYADLVLLDPNRVQDKATFEKPAQAPIGIEQVWVNGKVVLKEGNQTQELPGKFLSKN